MSVPSLSVRACASAALTACIAVPASAEGPAYNGSTGLLATPTAEVQAEGTAAFGYHHHTARPGGPVETDGYAVTIGFLPGLEIGGRAVEEFGDPSRDLSFNARYRLDLPGGLGIAVGAQDIGGEAQHYRAGYAVATLPWRSLSVSAGYGVGPHVLEGAFGGIEWRPWPFAGLIAEHDTDDVNVGIKLTTGDWLSDRLGLPRGLRLGASAAHRGVTSEIEYGAHLEFSLGRRDPPGCTWCPPRRSEGSPDSSAVAGVAGAADEAASIPPRLAPRDGTELPAGVTAVSAVAAAGDAKLRSALTAVGFESIRLGRRPPATQVVALENRRYNHSSADGIGLALGVIATRVGPDIEHIELTLFAYGVPQVTVRAPAALYRDFLADPAAHAAALRAALVVRQVSGIRDVGEIVSEPRPLDPLRGPELVVEPLLRNFFATEFGLFDYSLAARLRLTTPLGGGVLLHVGGQVPLAESDDFRSGTNFDPVGAEPGLDLALMQFAHKLAPQWTLLWSAGRSQVLRTDLDALALEQAWVSQQGTHEVRSKLMALHAGFGTRVVALAGYTWFDPAHDYSVALTGGRFYSGDGGVRLELNRWFGDTLCGLQFRAASRDDQAVGLHLSFPLTPRRDAMPGRLQVKGARRWSHTQSTTVNSFDNRNPLRPLLVYEPTLDLDLRRDFLDSGRLGEAYLRDELPRLHEAYTLWGE